MALTPNYAWPLPDMEDPANVPGDMKLLGDAIDAPLRTTDDATVPVGALLIWPTGVAPVGWLLCNGQQVDAALYPKLAAVLGQAGGLVTVPNLTNRVPLGAGGTHALGSTGGTDTVALTTDQLAAHSHPDNIAYAGVGHHGHTVAVAENQVIDPAHVLARAGGVTTVSGLTWESGGSWVAPHSTADGWGGANGHHGHVGSYAIADGGAHSHARSGGVQNAGSGQPHSNLQPYLAINFIIRAG